MTVRATGPLSDPRERNHVAGETWVVLLKSLDHPRLYFRDWEERAAPTYAKSEQDIDLGRSDRPDAEEPLRHLTYLGRRETMGLGSFTRPVPTARRAEASVHPCPGGRASGETQLRLLPRPFDLVFHLLYCVGRGGGWRTTLQL